ncbi:Alpha/Beta hydrolase protein [Crucibulum laeve]|uniref:Alpha/Beta hydrolase protein n=1 Tax=Crucibulum laeve TaxID=68775 RepID=A0A5C3LH91_9AGAR|nr:Alpha/Beta hydrolase protein [Crucibulum laeve]
MDSSLYHKVKTRRGFTYGYYLTPNPGKGKPTVLLIIGFPSTAQDWAPQFKYLTERGYGVIAPDMLGYGGTDKPHDADAYRASPMANDIIDILDKENTKTAFVVSHDWGVIVASRIVNLFPERVSAMAFLSLGYFPPNPKWDWEQAIEQNRKEIGSDVFGYWEFFASDDAPKLIETNLDSFYSMLFPEDPKLWLTDVAPRGKIREWLEGNKQSGLPSYMTKEKSREHQARIMHGGFTGPLNWYTARVRALDNEDDARIPLENYKIKVPTLFVSSTKDYICLPSLNEAIMRQYASNLTVKPIDTDHWVMIAAPDELSVVLDEFASQL